MQPLPVAAQVTREMDATRIASTTRDMLKKHRALSRWHSDFAQAFMAGAR